MDNKVLQEEEMESEVFVIQGIKSEDEEIKIKKEVEDGELKTENGIEEEVIYFEEDEFWSDKKVNCDGNYLWFIIDENFQLCQVTEAQKTRIMNTVHMYTTKTESEVENVKHAGCRNSGNNENDFQIKSKGKQDKFTKYARGKGLNRGPIQASYSQNDNALDQKRSIYNKPYQCNYCECHFVRKYQLENHAAFIHGKEKTFKCTECECSFTWKYKLESHAASVHGKEKSFKCTECECSFSWKFKLENHEASIHGKEKPFKCSDCDYSSCQNGNLANHIRSVHRKIKAFHCAECDHSFSVKSSLAHHIKFVHCREKIFNCTECDYSSRYKDHFARHVIAVHKKIKPYKCTECNYCCSDKGSLTKHISAVHRKEKPIKCKECDYSCSQGSSLKKHIISIHRKEKSFECPKCEFSSSESGNLAQHIKAVHEGVKVKRKNKAIKDIKLISVVENEEEEFWTEEMITSDRNYLCILNEEDTSGKHNIREGP